jgi:hypothetical protein
MLISSLFVKHKVQPPRFAPGLFLFLLAAFVLVGDFKPVYGLVGIGTTVLIAGVMIEVNRNRIWEMYLKTHKKQKGLSSIWTKPNKLYYNLNVYMVWPFVIFMGLVCLWSAYILSN